MSKYVLIYHGGVFPKTEEEGAKMMQDWKKWESSMGDALIDSGNGVGMSKTVMSDGAIVDNGGSNPTSGYSCISAENMDEALKVVQAHPFLSMQGSIEIAEAMVHE